LGALSLLVHAPSNPISSIDDLDIVVLVRKVLIWLLMEPFGGLTAGRMMSIESEVSEMSGV
jgi:hypothetical protein